MEFAIIENGVVVNRAESEYPLGPNWIPGANCHIGDLWDGETFTRPVVQSPPERQPLITKYAYANRFTQAERVAIRTAAATSPMIQDYLELLSYLSALDLSSPALREAVQALETAGLLDKGRSDQILSLDIKADEYFSG